MVPIQSDTGSSGRGFGSLAEMRLGSVISTMAAREPLPAAGSAVALTLSFAAALLEKATSVPRAGVPIDSAAHGRAERLRHDALALADEDAATYRRVGAAKGDAERVRSALSKAADPPLAMAEIGVKLAELADRLLDDVPLRLQGEVRSAGHLACAAATAATELATIDLGEGDDGRRDRLVELAAEAAAFAQALSERGLRA